MNQGGYDLRRDVDKLLNKTTELAKDYFIQINSPIITFKDDVFTPSILTATAYESSQDLTDFYEGILDLWVSTDEGEHYTFVKSVTGHTISQTMSDITVNNNTIDIDDVTHFRVNMYDETYNVLDRQTIAIVKTKDGKDAITILLGNEAQLIAVDGNGSLKSNPTTITIPVYCYKGTSKVAGTIDLSDVSNTFSTKTKVDPTASNNGSVTLSCTSVPNQITNDEPIKVTVDGETITKYFTWSKIGDGKDGNAGGTYDFVYYTKNNSTPPTISSSTTIDPNTGRNVLNTWCARPTDTTSSNQYCFGAYRKLDHTGTPTGNYSDVYLWAKYGEDGVDGEDGEDGADGKGLEMIFCRTSTPNGYSTNPSTLPAVQTPDYVPSGWTDDQTGVDSTHQYEYVCLRTSDTSGVWSKFTAPRLWAKYGEDGEQGIPGIDGDNISAGGVIEKVVDFNFSPTGVGSVSNSVPSDFVGTVAKKLTLTKGSNTCLLPSYLDGTGSIMIARQGNMVTINFDGLGLSTSFPVDTQDHKSIFTLPDWAKPLNTVWFSSVLDNSVLSCTTDHIRIRRISTGGLYASKMSGSASYIVDDNAGKKECSLSWVSTSAVAQGGYVQARLLDNSSNPIEFAYIYFRVNDVIYKRETNGSGIATLNINLPYRSVGYNIIAWFDGGEYDQNTGQYLSSAGIYKYKELTSTYFTVNKASTPTISWGYTTGGGGVQYYAQFVNSATGSYPIRNHPVYLNIGGSGWAKMETDNNGRAYFRLDGYSGSVTVQAKIEAGDRVATTNSGSNIYSL